MNVPSRRRRRGRLLIVLLFAAIVGVVSYNLGLAQGLARQVPAGSPVAYAWPHPWGFGLLFPLLFFGFWFVVVRGLLGGGRYRAWHHGYGCQGGGAYGPPMLDEWHRRAHERDRPDPQATSV